MLAGNRPALLDYVAGRAGYGDVRKKYRKAFLPVFRGNHDGVRHHCESGNVSQAEKNTDGGIPEIGGIEAEKQTLAEQENEYTIDGRGV